MSLKIDKILALEDGEHHFQFDVTAGAIGMNSRDFEGREHFETPIHAEVVLSKTNHVYAVKLKVTAAGRFLCDRCLSDVAFRVEDTTPLIFTDQRDKRAEERGETSEDIRLIDIRRENEIRLDKDLTDTLMLAIPSKMLCRDDCKGLCPQCGENLNERLCEHVTAEHEA